jgi:Derlin-2/3
MDVEQAWNNIPIVTKCYLVLTVALNVAAAYELASPYLFYFDWNLIWNEGEWWRLVTSFVRIGSIDIHLFFHLHMFHSYSKDLEEHFYLRHTAHYLYVWLATAAAVIGVGYFTSAMWMDSMFLSVLLYMWSRRYPDEQLMWMFFVQFTSKYLPWFYVCVMYCLGAREAAKADLLAIGVGHVVWYLSDVLPQLTGWNPMSPAWFHQMFPREQRVHQPRPQQQQQQQDEQQ